MLLSRGRRAPRRAAARFARTVVAVVAIHETLFCRAGHELSFIYDVTRENATMTPPRYRDKIRRARRDFYYYYYYITYAGDIIIIKRRAAEHIDAAPRADMSARVAARARHDNIKFRAFCHIIIIGGYCHMIRLPSARRTTYILSESHMRATRRARCRRRRHAPRLRAQQPPSKCAKMRAAPPHA